MNTYEFETHITVAGVTTYKVAGAPYDFWYCTQAGALKAWEIWQELRRKTA